jgi:tRNA G18 (ribose-2'-O)-methylase SpoU
VHVIYVDDPGDERLSDFQAVSDPDLARTRGLFIAEGRLVVRRLLTESTFAPRAVLVTPSAMKALEDVLPARPGVAIYIVKKDVMDGVAGFNIHRGCLATGERPAPADWRSRLAGARRLVILERVGDADNVGAIFRSAAAFGGDAVLTGPACADPLYRKAIRTSMGAALILPFADASPWPAMLRDLKAEGWAVAAMTPAADAMPLRDFSSATRPQRVAIVLGHEGEGLTAGALEACDYRVRIPIHASVDSLNVATAAAIALYELGQV